MSLQDERKTFEGRFFAQWGSTTPVKWENVPFDEPQPAAPWVAFSIRPNFAEQASLGRPKFVERIWGYVVVQIFVPENSGTVSARSLAQQAGDVFKAIQVSLNATTEASFLMPEYREIGSNAGWYQINVACPYYWCKQPS